MPPQLLVDLDKIDLEKDLFDAEAVEAVNPHRYEMRQLDGIVYYEPDEGVFVGYKNIRQDEFWVRGHIPGRPLMPGVVMVEAAAQLCSFAAKKVQAEDRFIGFGGIEDVKFRQTVVPGDKLYLAAKFIENRARRFVCDTQGIVNGKMAFQARIIGMVV